MSLKSYQTNSPRELVATQKNKEEWSKMAVYFTLLWTLIFVLLLKSMPNVNTLLFKGTQTDQITVTFFLLYLCLLPPVLSLWVRALNKNVKLLVNENGIGFSTNLFERCNHNPYKWFLGISKSTINKNGIGHQETFYRWTTCLLYTSPSPRDS